MPNSMNNLFAQIPAKLPAELTEILLQADNIQIERIVSRGHRSADAFWYDQPRHEWVVLLAGEAGLHFADEPHPRKLKPGDYVQIEAHRRHRVEWTSAREDSIWLAIHYG